MTTEVANRIAKMARSVWALLAAALGWAEAFLAPPVRRVATTGVAAGGREREVDTSQWEYYARHPMARGAKLDCTQITTELGARVRIAFP